MEDTTTGQNVVLDFSKIEISLNVNDKQLVRDCAITLYTNTNFDQNEKSSFQIAQESVDRAVIMISELKKRGII